MYTTQGGELIDLYEIKYIGLAVDGQYKVLVGNQELMLDDLVTPRADLVAHMRHVSRGE
jgi:hypothetical protein